MPKRSFFPSFFIFIILSVLFIFLSKTGILNGPASLIAKIASPIEKISFGFSSSTNKDNSIVAENKQLIKKLVDFQKMATENSALRDQFETTSPASQNLLPANVVSASSFIPGISSPEYLVIDKGKKDGIKTGMAVVFKDNLLGKITEISDSLSRVILVSNPSISFSAKTISIKGEPGASALGIISGMGGQDMILGNVLLSDTLAVGDYVTTKGDLQVDNAGFPPSIIIGKITSVEKKASDLFQRAKVKSLLDFSKLSTVFVVLSQ